MNAKEIAKLKVGDFVKCFDDEEEEWITCKVIDIKRTEDGYDSKIWFKDFAGRSFKKKDLGWNWEADLVDLYDDKYFLILNEQKSRSNKPRPKG